MACEPNVECRQESNVGEPRGRRNFLAQSAAVLATAACCNRLSAAQAYDRSQSSARPRFRYCLNTSTINGSQVPLREQLKVAAQAGYDAVELWIRDIDRYLEAGGSKQDLKKEIEDLGLGIDSGIAFGQWIVDDPARRRQGLEQCKRDMALLREIGGHRIAAPPSGATSEAGLNLAAAGERYRELLEVGKTVDVLPQVELWGFSANLSTLAEILYVAAAADHEDACVLLDVYHLYKGGCNFNNLDLVPGRKMYCLHMNDYPADPPRELIKDEHRVYPGDGIAPISSILRTLAAGGFDGTLSLELFNRSYWQQPPQQVAVTGLEKMKQCVATAFGS